jgi:alginate O-acetyltransferase complex protein AlgJ
MTQDKSAKPAAAHRGGPTDPSHDEDLRRGILRTAVTRRTAWVMVLPFLLAVYAIPIGQIIHDRRAGDESVLLDLFRHAPTRENIRQFEDELDKASTAREYLRPRVQAQLTRFGGHGNGKATIGRGGWLFYTPGITAVGGPPFLDPEVQAARRSAAETAGDPPVSPDPRPAVLDFARFLASRGIRLVVFPVPDKVSLQPLELHGRARDAGRGAPARNPDALRFAAELEAAGVLVFDPTPPALAAGEPPRFMKQDTHWTPAWMEAVAGQLAELLVARGLVPREPGAERARAWKTVARTMSRVGDVTDMLGLPEGQTLFAPESQTIHEVQDATGAPFEPSERGTVLVLGDSFTNVFSLEPMGWGTSAGLVPQLARALGRDVDVIARNDAGAHATRRMLFDALAGGEDRLAGKTVVVWELASRELAVGDFKPIDWSSLAAGGAAR